MKPRPFVLASFVLPLAAIVACNGGPTAPATDRVPSVNPSALASPAGPASAGPVALASGPLERLVNMLDACDPETFNAVLGPGTCVRSGGVTFQHFIDQLTRLTFVGSWRFAPQHSSLRVGQTLVAANKGGEVHTFTEVDEFGGGIVPVLNTLAQTPTIAPECGALGPADFIAPGGETREEVEQAGTARFQCCIHPWMKLEAKVSDK